MTAIEPLEPTPEPRWLITKNLRGSVVESYQLSAGTDLKRAFLKAMLDWIDAGWTLGEFNSRTGHFVCTRDVDRRTVIVSSEPPGPRGRMR
jgi:hypothetical protein